MNELANKNKKNCLAIDYSGMNTNKPGRFRTEADNLVQQTYYFNVQNDDMMFNAFINNRVNNENLSGEIYFEIGKVKSKTNKQNFTAKLELKNLVQNNTNDDRYSQLGHGVNEVKNSISTSESSSKRGTRLVKQKFLLVNNDNQKNNNTNNNDGN